MMHRLLVLMSAGLAFGGSITSCGGSVEAPTATPVDAASAPSPTTVAAPVATTTTDTAMPTTTTTAATTTAATTTTTTTTTTAAAAATPATAVTSTTVTAAVSGWTELDPEAVSVKAFPPCCADTWHGAASPPPAEPGATLADGPYAARTRWPADLTEPLELELRRFEMCALLPDGSCEPAGPAGYGPDDLGVDSATTGMLTVPLDGSVDVVVVGWDTEGRFDVQRATGTELAALAAEVDQAYADVFAQPVLDGGDPSVVVADVIERPRSGFGPGVGSVDAIAYTPSSGPTLLFQGVYPYVDGRQVVGRGVDVLDVGSIDVVGGEITVYVYAAYVP